MRFSKEHQPTNRRKPSGNAKVVMSVRVKPSTKEYFKSHNVRGGDVLDEYVKDK